MNTSITYTSSIQPAVTITLGWATDSQGRRIEREGACSDIYLLRALAIDCPLNLALLIRTDGTIVEWRAEFDGASIDTRNTYWHAHAGLPSSITAQQIETLAKIHLGAILPFGGVRGCLGRSATDAFAGYNRAHIETLANVEPNSLAYNG